MMKRKYLAPETIQVAFRGKIVMSATSPREAGGGPTNPEDGGKPLPGVIGETDNDTDPYGGHGQGTGGGGNRAKGTDLWGWDW